VSKIPEIGTISGILGTISGKIGTISGKIGAISGMIGAILTIVGLLSITTEVGSSCLETVQTGLVRL
jgi:hypothetical protein